MIDISWVCPKPDKLSVQNRIDCPSKTGCCAYDAGFWNINREPLRKSTCLGSVSSLALTKYMVTELVNVVLQANCKLVFGPATPIAYITQIKVGLLLLKSNPHFLCVLWQWVASVYLMIQLIPSMLYNVVIG
jgi:hypothetical protein